MRADPGAYLVPVSVWAGWPWKHEAMSEVRPFVIDVPQGILDDLAGRLRRTLWPVQSRTPAWSEGADGDFLAGLVAFWRERFDWRAQERSLNQFAHFRVDLDGSAVHFVHERGRGPDPLPLILTHGWPSTFYELLPLVPLLTDPERHGGTADESFDVVIPSLPGYGFSDPPGGPGSANRIPGCWNRLMVDVLGYDRFGAHGGDIGAMVTNRLACEFPSHLAGIHVALVAEPSLGPVRHR